MDYREFLERRGVDTYDGAGSSDFLITCPFHDDTSPSLEVHYRKGMFYCFGCKTTGPFSKLLAEIENITELDAKRILMRVDDTDSVINDLHNIFDELDEDEEKVKYYSVKSFHKTFPEITSSKTAIQYLRRRKIADAHSKYFDLRWGTHAHWKNRVIIPIYTEAGKLLTYAGRTVVPNVKPKTRKIKGRSPRSTLFGLYDLLRYYEVEKFNNLIVVEGEFDAIYLQSLGLPAVSTMGTMGLTGEQLFLLKKHASGVLYSYDGDDAGQKAQIKAIAKTRKYVPTVGLDLPPGQDPNELSWKQVEKIYRGLFL